MPSARNPDVRGHLYVTFAVDFPPDNTMSDEALNELERVLPPRPDRSAAAAAAAALQSTVSVNDQPPSATAAEERDGEDASADTQASESAAVPVPEPEVELITAQLEELSTESRESRAKARRQRFNPFAAMFGGAFAGDFNDSDEEQSSPSRERQARNGDGDDKENAEGDGDGKQEEGEGGGERPHRQRQHTSDGDEDEEIDETMRNLLGDDYVPGGQDDESGPGGPRGPQVQCAQS